MPTTFIVQLLIHTDIDYIVGGRRWNDNGCWEMKAAEDIAT